MYVAETVDVTALSNYNGLGDLGSPGRRRKKRRRRTKRWLRGRWGQFRRGIKTLKEMNEAIAAVSFIAHYADRWKFWGYSKSAYQLLRALVEQREKKFPKWECKRGMAFVPHGEGRIKWLPKSLVEVHCERAFGFMPKTECVKKLSWLYCEIPPEKAITVPQRLRLLPVVKPAVAGKPGPPKLSGIFGSEREWMEDRSSEWLNIRRRAIAQLGQVGATPYEEGLAELENMLKEPEFKRFYPVIAGGLLTVAIWKALHPEAGEMMDYEKEAIHKWAQGMAATGELEKTWMYARKLLEPIPVTSRNLAELAHWKMALARQDKEATHGYKLNGPEYGAMRYYEKRKKRRRRRARWRKVATVLVVAAVAVAVVVAIPGAAAGVWTVVKAVGTAVAKAAVAVAEGIWWAIKGAAGIVYKGGKWVYDSLIKPLFVGADGKAGEALNKTTKAAKEAGIMDKLLKEGGDKLMSAGVNLLKQKVKEKLTPKEKKMVEKKQMKMTATTKEVVDTIKPTGAGDLPRPLKLEPQPPSQPPPKVTMPGKPPEVPKSVAQHMKIPTAVMVGIPAAAAVLLLMVGLK